MSQEIIKELGGSVCLQTEQRWKDGQMVSEVFHAISSEGPFIEKSEVSLEDALQKVLEVRKEKAARPKKEGQEEDLDGTDLYLLDDLETYALLFDLLERDDNLDAVGEDFSLGAVLLSASRKMMEVHRKFAER